MKILLDLDDTVIISGRLHPRFCDFMRWIEDRKQQGLLPPHEVVVWSSHEDGEAIAELMGFSYLSKDSEEKPDADVLIDDSCDQFIDLCSVDIRCSTFASFLVMVNA